MVIKKYPDLKKDERLKALKIIKKDIEKKLSSFTDSDGDESDLELDE